MKEAVQRKKILILEHDHNDIDLIEYELNKSGILYDVEIVGTESALKNALIDFQPDVVLSDYSMPSFNGKAAFRICRQSRPGMPFIIISAHLEEGDSMELIKSGLTDLVMKDKLYTLAPKLKRALRELEETETRRSMEKELVMNQFRLNEAQRIARMGSWERIAGSLEFVWSEQMYHLLGYAPGEVAATLENYCKMIHPEDRSMLTEMINYSAESKQDIHCLHRLICSDGSVKYLYGESRIELNAQGNVSRQHGIVQDITAMHLDKENLLRSEARHRQAQEIAHVGNWELDIESNQLFWSEEMYRMYGMETSRGAVNMVKWLSLLHPEDIEMFQHFVYGDSAVEALKGFHHKITCKDGSERYLYLESKTEFNDAGEPIQHYGIVHDVTEQKRTEMQLKQLLNISKEQNNRLRNFTYIVSHKVRAHSANISGLVDIYWDMTGGDQESMYFDMLKSNAVKLSETIVDLNDVITFKEGVNRDRKVLNLRNEVEKISNALNLNTGKSNFRLLNQVPENTSMLCVESYMENILYNLIAHSFKSRPADRKLTMTFTAEETEKYLKLILSDNGTGLSIQNHDADMTAKEEVCHLDSAGIGFYIAKHQVEAMNGRIEVESDPVKGTVFELCFLKF